MKKIIEINDVSPIVLSGANDDNIKLIEKEFSSLIVFRGNKISLDGKKKEVELIAKIFQGMISIAVKKEHVSKNDVKTLINLSNLENSDLELIKDTDDIIILNSKEPDKVIGPKLWMNQSYQLFRPASWQLIPNKIDPTSKPL